MADQSETTIWALVAGAVGALGLGGLAAWYFQETLKRLLPAPLRTARWLRTRDIVPSGGIHFTVLIADPDGDDDNLSQTKHVEAALRDQQGLEVVLVGPRPKPFEGGSRAEHQIRAESEARVDDLAPEGALLSLLAGRIARAAWRLERAERIETELFAREMHGVLGDGDLGLALLGDGNGARAFDTLLRYRGATQAEFSRALRLLKALQDEAAPRRRARPQLSAAPEQTLLEALPNGPEAREIAGKAVPTAAADEAAAGRDTRQAAQTAEPAIDPRQSEHRSEAPGRSNPTPAGILARSALRHLEGTARQTLRIKP